MFTDKNQEYILAVKNNLRVFLHTVNYKIDNFGSFTAKDEDNKRFKTLTFLCRELEEKSDKENNTYRLNKPDNKLKKLLSDETDVLDAYFINEICELYKFPIERIFSTEKISFKEAQEIMTEIAKDAEIRKKPFAPLSKLSHKSYFGEFYGYTFDHNPNEEDTIIKFKLNIFEDENFMPKAEYTFYNRNLEKQLFTGTPYYISELKTILIEMTANNNRRYQYLYFNGAPYNSQKITYKSGTCVRTSTASNNHEPDVKSFVLTGCELPEKVVQNIIPGLLKMTSNVFYILSSELERLELESPEIKEFHEKYASDFSLLDNCVFMVKERKIIENTKYESKSERILAFRCLTAIRAFALAPNRINYRNTEADYNFFKQFEEELSETMSY